MSSQKPQSQPGWIQHTLRSAPWRRQSQFAAIVALALIVAIIIGALYLAQVTRVSTTGRQNEELRMYRDQLVRQNEQIRADIADLRSVPRLLRRAQELGFTYAGWSDIEYLVVEGYAPHLPVSVAPLTPEDDFLPAYDESFAGWLRQQWLNLSIQFEEWTEQVTAGPVGE